MAKRELGPAALQVVHAVAAVIPAGPVVVGTSGGGDSMALALAAQWVSQRKDVQPLAVVVDHGLQPGSDEVAAATVTFLRSRGMAAEMRRVQVEQTGDGLEAAAREARLAALSADGHPVLLGHSMDDQAEQVLLALLRGSGARALAGIPAQRGLFLRPLLGLRRSVLRAACQEWDAPIWDDPHNADPRFARVRARGLLAELTSQLGHDVVPNLARTADLARLDADHLEDQAARYVAAELEVETLAGLPAAIRQRVIHQWLLQQGATGVGHVHVAAVEKLMVQGRGNSSTNVPGGRVILAHKRLRMAIG